MEYTLYTVAVALIRDKKLYVSQRINTTNFAGKWQFAGGKLEENENHFDGGIREVKEETGITLTKERLHYLYPIHNDPSTFACFLHVVHLKSNEIPQRTEDKMSEWQLMEPDEILKLDLMPGIPQAIEDLKALRFV